MKHRNENIAKEKSLSIKWNQIKCNRLIMDIDNGRGNIAWTENIGGFK